MQVRAATGFVILCVLLVPAGPGCTFTSPSNSSSSLPSRINIELIPPEHAIQGEPADYTFVITNETEHPIILLELIPTSRDVAGGSTASRTIKAVQDGSEHRWTHLLGGTLTSQPNQNTYTYTPSSHHLPGSAQKRLYSGLLFPGRNVRVNLRMLHLQPGRFTQHFTLRYHRTSQNALRKRMYVPEQPLTDHRDQKDNVVFRKIPRDNGFSLSEPSFFILNPPYQIVVEQTFSRDIRVFEGSFPPSAAEDRIRKETNLNPAFEQFRFDPWFDRWIIRTGDDQVWGVSKKSVERLPEGSFIDHKYLATARGPVSFYPGPTIPANSQRIAPLTHLPEEGNSRQRHTDVRNAIELLQNLRESGMDIQWTREPVTNNPAAIVLLPENK